MTNNKEWATVCQSICAYEHAPVLDFLNELLHPAPGIGPTFIQRGWEVRLQWRQVFDYASERLDKEEER